VLAVHCNLVQQHLDTTSTKTVRIRPSRAACWRDLGDS